MHPQGLMCPAEVCDERRFQDSQWQGHILTHTEDSGEAAKRYSDSGVGPIMTKLGQVHPGYLQLVPQRTAQTTPLGSHIPYHCNIPPLSAPTSYRKIRGECHISST